MDSLLSNYASSDEEEEEPQNDRSKSDTPNPSPSIFSSLAPPKSSSSSSSLFSFLPPPKSDLPNPTSQTLTNPSSSKPTNQFQQKVKPPSLSSTLPQPKSKSSSSSSIFSFLPPPKSHEVDAPALTNPVSTPVPKPKKIVQLKLPLPSMTKSRDSDDEDDDEVKERERKKSRESVAQTATVKSFLSSIPAPKNSSTFGSLPSAAGSGRRSILEADVPSLNSNGLKAETEVGVSSNVGNYDGQLVDGLSSASLGEVGGSEQYGVGSGGGDDASGWVSSSANYENYEGYGGYGSYDYQGQYASNWDDGSTTMVPSDMAGTGEKLVKVPGRKRGRNEVPQDIVEVNQDELMKNRPREDQVKLTGIAFGPSYQPVSSKGKPSKLHKKKHQIGTLFFDMKQKEMELAERRAKGFLTKAETQAKYGW